MMPVRFRLFALLGLICLLAVPLPGKDVVVIADKRIPRSEKEAILILPGFGSLLHGSKRQKQYFSDQGYDLFIPDYISRKSVDRSVQRLDAFFEKQHLSEYKKVHVFSYIVGAWVLNRWIDTHPQHPIRTIVYDRSPLQERAPYALVKDRPFLIRLAAGRIMKEFSETPYRPLPQQQIRMGIVVECKATNLIKRHRKTALSMGPVRWDLGQFEQPHDDFVYTWLNHDDMYGRFDIIGPEIMHFIREGHFSAAARRIPYEEDPFIPYQEQPK